MCLSGRTPWLNPLITEPLPLAPVLYRYGRMGGNYGSKIADALSLPLATFISAKAGITIALSPDDPLLD
eukprot:gene957-2618_t